MPHCSYQDTFILQDKIEAFLIFAKKKDIFISRYFCMCVLVALAILTLFLVKGEEHELNKTVQFALGLVPNNRAIDYYYLSFQCFFCLFQSFIHTYKVC